MKKSVLALILILLVSCKSKEQKLKESITPVITQAILQDSLVNKIDSLIIYKIDTLTDVEYSLKKIDNLNRRVAFYIEMRKSYYDRAELDQKSAKLNISQARLYSGILDSKVLRDISIDDAKAKLKSSQELLDKGSSYLDSAKNLNKIIDEIHKKIKNGEINRKSFKGYIASFRLMGSDNRNTEVKKDSMYIYISPALRIIPMSKI